MASPKRILIVKLADLGDLLLAEPALRSLHLAFPDARIDLLTTPRASELAGLIAPWANVIAIQRDELLSGQLTAAWHSLKQGASLATQGYDLAVLLHHLTTSRGAMRQRLLALISRADRVVGLDNGRGRFLTDTIIDPGFGIKHEAELLLEVAIKAGGAPVEPIPRLEPLPSPVDLETDYAVIAPTAGGFSRAREWSSGRFATVARALIARHDLTPVIVGTVEASTVARKILGAAPAAINLVGKTSVPALIGLSSHASLIVSNDSFPAHLSAALDRPSVTIFGPSNRVSWAPAGSVLDSRWDMSPSRRVTVSADIPCSPCLYTGYRLGRPSGCPTRTCLDLIDVDRVLRAIEHVLGE